MCGIKYNRSKLKFADFGAINRSDPNFTPILVLLLRLIFAHFWEKKALPKIVYSLLDSDDLSVILWM